MKYKIITFGCQMNKSDSERIASLLEKKGYQPVAKEVEADLIVVNMCSIRQSAVDRVYGKANNLTKLKIKNPKLKTILTGCILKKDKVKLAKKFDQILEFKNLLNYSPKVKNNSLAYIPISNGCINFCSYCVVPYTRGPLVCRKYKDILKETKKAIKNGAKEIWLLGQNVNDYQDQEINFAKLIKLVNNLQGDFKFFFVSPHPKDFSDELIEVLAQSKKYSQSLNLPVQSGDNQILKKMRRPYTATQYKKLVTKIRKKMPEIFLSTDIIVGFPGETKKQFTNTVKLFREMDFEMAYISKYSSRPNTLASKMKDNVSLKEKERRWQVLNNILLKKWEKKPKK